MPPTSLPGSGSIAPWNSVALVATLVDEEEVDDDKIGDKKIADDKARARAMALLEATHQFPCDYAFTVIAFGHEAVTESVRRAARRDVEAESRLASEARESGAPDELQEARQEARPDARPDELPGYEVRPSREGKYLSHRFTVRVTSAHEVLQFYARLRSLEGVVTIL